MDPQLQHLTYLPYFEHNKTFLESRKQSLFHYCHQVQCQKNLLNRSRQKFKNADFGLKNDPFMPSRA